MTLNLNGQQDRTSQASELSFEVNQILQDEIIKKATFDTSKTAHNPPQAFHDEVNGAKSSSRTSLLDNKCYNLQKHEDKSNSVSSFTGRSARNSQTLSRLNLQQCQDPSSRRPSSNQFTEQHEHKSSTPFSNNTYSAFKKGNVVRGILCPSLTNSFR